MHVKNVCRVDLIFVCLAAPAILLAQADRIAGTIDSAQTITASGMLAPLAQSRYDQGPVEASFRLSYMRMMLPPAAAQQTALDQLLAAQQNPASPQFHKWLTPEQYADRFGASAKDVAKIEQWLNSAGFSIEYSARGRDWIAFSGTAAQVQAAFHAEVHRYLIDGEAHFAISSDPRIPAALGPLVGAILGLNDFTPKPFAAPTASNPFNTLAPGDLASIYDINPLYKKGINGTGQAIAIVGESQLALTDIQTFRTTWGLSAANVQTVLVGGNPGTAPNAQTEADLDVEWAGAIAPGAKLIFVYSTSPDSAAFYAVDQNLAPILSESLGQCESTVTAGDSASYETEAKKANAEGITWVVASGDSGAATCDTGFSSASHGVTVSFPASVPEITAVGGTEFNEGSADYWNLTNSANGGSALGYIPEMTWNDGVYGSGQRSGLVAGGGGGSSLYPKPAWQSGPGVPADGQRDLPDIAFAASAQHDGYNIVYLGQPLIVGGTSASTPVFAGMLALLNQYTSNLSTSNQATQSTGLGNINMSLYPLAMSAPAMFHDVTASGNVVPCKAASLDCINGQLGFNAGPGYDLATGLGSMDVYNFAIGWAGQAAGTATITTVSPSSAAAGGPAFTLTVNGSNFVPSAVVQWDGIALPTKMVSETQLTATVGASLIGMAGTTAITISSGATITGPLYFTEFAAPLTFSDPRVMSQAPAIVGGPGTSCTGFPAVSYFATNMTPYVFFIVPADIAVTYFWVAPDGTISGGGSGGGAVTALNSSSWCLWAQGPSFAHLTASQLGAWTVRAYANDTLLFSLPFTVQCSIGAPAITSIDSASAFGAFAYFASGSWLEIKGVNLADPADPRLTTSSSPGQWTTNDFNGVNAPTSLDGISVSIDGKPAYVWFLSAGQLNVQAPEDTAMGNVAVTVTNCKASSSPFQFARQGLAPGLLAPASFAINGTQYLEATFASDGAYVLSTSMGAALGIGSRAAKPGDVIIAYGVGFGDVTPTIVPGTIVEQANALNNPVTVSFGSANATLVYAGLAGNLIGLYEFYITVPPGLADGDYQINFTQNGSAVPQTVFLTVQN
ncbi:MAG TPA: protease pro-enzyme activation domain-containing protein [Bryobacteraceae bacterium]|jgi:uncharacterized protein (TIGR03437 family)